MQNTETMRNEQALMNRIKSLGKSILPKDGSLWLYGSRARGTATNDSDWDILILLNKEKRTPEDFEKYSFPFTDLGYEFNELVNPHLYTKKQWEDVSFSPFVKNVEQDKIVLV